MADNSPANAAQKQGGRWLPGQSGNPAGKRPGTRHKSTLAMEALLDGEGEELTRKAVELAKGGDVAALRLCFERLLPPRRDRPVSFDLPAITSAGDAAAAMAGVVEGVASGAITPTEGQAVAGLLETFVKTLETADFEQRLARLEQERGKP